MKTYDINEAADFLKIDRSTALELAHIGTLPGDKVGRSWVFMEDELVAYLRDVTRKQTQARRANAAAAQVIGRGPSRSRSPGAAVVAGRCRNYQSLAAKSLPRRFE